MKKQLRKPSPKRALQWTELMGMPWDSANASIILNPTCNRLLKEPLSSLQPKQKKRGLKKRGKWVKGCLHCALWTCICLLGSRGRLKAMASQYYYYDRKKKKKKLSALRDDDCKKASHSKIPTAAPLKLGASLKRRETNF